MYGPGATQFYDFSYTSRPHSAEPNGSRPADYSRNSQFAVSPAVQAQSRQYSNPMQSPYRNSVQSAHHQHQQHQQQQQQQQQQHHSQHHSQSHTALRFDTDENFPDQFKGLTTPPIVLQAKRCIDVMDGRGLMLAISKMSEEELSLPYAALDSGTLLHYAVDLRRMPAVQILVTAGASVGNVEDSQKLTPMELAMRRLPEALPQMLADGKGKNMRRIDADGRNLLHHTVWGKVQSHPWPRLPFLHSLLDEHAVSCGLLDNRGFTPAQWARENYLSLGDEADEIIELLEAPRKPDFQLNPMTNRGWHEVAISPWVRLACVLLMAGLHAVQYCVDLTMRIDSEKIFTFNYIFHTFSMIGTNWSTTNTSQIIAKVVSILLGLLVSAFVAYFVIHKLLLKGILGFRIFGAGRTAPDRGRGSLYLAFFFAFAGVYFGGLVYNEIADRHFSAKDAELKMRNEIGVTRRQAIQGFTITTLVCDAYTLILVFDTMVQQAAKRVFLPFSRFGGFCSSLHRSYSKVRLLLFWTLFPACVFGIVFGVIYERDAFTRENDPPIPTRNPAQRVAVTTVAIFFDVVVMLQEWTMPYLHRIAIVDIPGLCFAANNAWLLWFTATIVLALDIRLLIAQLEMWIEVESFDGGMQQFALAASLIPLAFAALLLIITLMRNSLWWRACGGVDDDRVRPFSGVTADDEDSELDEKQPLPPPPPPLTTQIGGITVFTNSPAGAKSSGRAHAPLPPPSGASRAHVSRGAPDVPPQTMVATATTATTRRTAKNKMNVNNDAIWLAAHTDDVIFLCALLDEDPTLLDKRGGPGIYVDHGAHFARVCSPPDARLAATPLHYAIVGGASSSVAALMTRGANPRIRTSHGMWTAHELARIVGSSLLDNYEDLVAGRGSGGGGGGFT